MGEKFDEFSKHMAGQKHSRRGLLKLFGAGAIGAAAASVFSGTASAKPKFNGSFNQTVKFPVINTYYPPEYTEKVAPYINQIQPQLDKIEQKAGTKLPFFPFNFFK